MQKIHLNSELETIELAKKVARYAVAGDIICLKGTLGMGKSTFARAFINALSQVEVTVPSPTFTLVQEYTETRLPVVHVDAYRMEDASELESLDLYDYFTHGITLVEWPENIESALPKRGERVCEMMECEEGDTLTIQLLEGDVETSRDAELTARGAWLARFGVMFPTETDRPVTKEGRKKFLDTQGLGDVPVIQICGALSCRTYWRLETSQGARILMDAPPPMEDVKPFVAMAEVYEKIGAHVPHIDGKDEKDGYLILEDFGDVPLSSLTDENQQKAWLEACVDLLIQVAKSGTHENVPTYGLVNTLDEAVRYVDWYLPYETGHATSLSDRMAFVSVWEKLYEKATKVPFMLTHWDFHSDNLMAIQPTPSLESLGVLDFQDARMAPVTFDLACLLEDRWKKPLSEELKTYLIERMVNGLDGVEMDDFMVSYRIVMLHRMLKITGLYNRASKRDGRTDLPWDMNAIWNTTVKTLQSPEFDELRALMEKLSPQELRKCA